VSEPEKTITFTTYMGRGFAKTITTQAETIGGVPFTRRRANWLKGYLQALSEGATGDAAAIRGGRLGGIGGIKHLSDLAIKKKMEGFLALPDVKQAMRSVYEEGAAFNLTDALAQHVKHIQGFTVEQQQATKDGEIVTFEQTIPPSWPALKDYLDRTTPKEAHRVNVLTARVGINREVRTDGSAPPMAARAIGENTIEG